MKEHFHYVSGNPGGFLKSEYQSDRDSSSRKKEQEMGLGAVSLWLFMAKN